MNCKIYDIKNGTINKIDNIHKYLEDEKNIIKDNGVNLESNEKIYEVNNLSYSYNNLQDKNLEEMIKHSDLMMYKDKEEYYAKNPK